MIGVSKAEPTCDSPAFAVKNLRIDEIAETRPLFYENQDLAEFEGRVLKVFNDSKHSFVVLDQTAFYARAGGQEPDSGTLDNHKVLEDTLS